jgi:RNA polymerase-binding transcription factor DksA
VIKDNRGRFVSKYKEWSLDNFDDGYISKYDGRFIVIKPGHTRADKSGQIFRSIVAYEAYNNDIVPIGYVIHHKDGNRLNDNKENLVKMEHGEHTRLHWTGKSREGQNEHLRNGQYLVCTQCGCRIYRPQWRLNRFTPIMPFCCAKCRNDFNRNKKYFGINREI